MAFYTQVLVGNKAAMVDLKTYTNVQITNALLVHKDEGVDTVNVWISYVPVLDTGSRKKPSRVAEIFATFKDGQKTTEADYMVTDEMEASVYTTDGAEVKLSGIYMSFSDDEEGVKNDDVEEDGSEGDFEEDSDED